MNAWILFQRMLELFAMMVTGYFCYRRKWLDDNSYEKLSKIVVNILNPLIIINGVMNSDLQKGTEKIFQNLMFVLIYFGILIIISFPVSGILHTKKAETYLYQTMCIFSNVGFIGIPVVESIYGTESTLYISFYILIYNFLLYTYGVSRIRASARTVRSEEIKTRTAFQWGKLFNAGTAACLISVIIVISGIRFPSAAESFVSYMGNAAIPMSMILIGVSMARQNIRSMLSDIRMYFFLFIRMSVVPVTAAIAGRWIPVDRQLYNIFCLMLAMPVGSILVLIATDQKADEKVFTDGSVLSTLFSVITIPLTALFLL